MCPLIQKWKSKLPTSIIQWQLLPRKRSSFLSSGKTRPNTKLEEELSRYKAEMHETDESKDPMDFWVSVENQYPSLSSVAYDLLVIPASSAPIERVFSTSGVNLTWESIVD